MVNGALSISSLTLSDTGMYQCIAENRHGRVFANAELKVIGKKSLLTKDIATHILKYIAYMQLARLYKVCFVSQCCVALHACCFPHKLIPTTLSANTSTH